MKIKFELGAILLIILCLFQQEKVKKYFKPVNVVCQEYNSRDIVKNGTYSRKLIFLEIGEKNCVVQKYKCNKCGHIIYTDLSSIVNGNSNITIPVIEHIEFLYSYFNVSLHKNS